MDVQGLIIFFATIIGIGITVNVIRKRLRYYNFSKEADETYWGHYEGASAEPISAQRVKLPKISFKQVITVGGSGYAKGKAVKSAKAK